MPPRRALSSDHGGVATARSNSIAPAAATGNSSPTQPASPPSTGRDAKRRKIRKGTHSCWACKRKKIRCTFSTPDGTPIDLEEVDAESLTGLVCDGCRRRGTPCVSQDLPETTALSAAANHSRQVDDRLGRMEALVEMLVKNVQQQQEQQQQQQQQQNDDLHRQYQALRASTGRGGRGTPSVISSSSANTTSPSDASPASRRATYRRRPSHGEEEEGGPDTLGPQSHEPPAAGGDLHPERVPPSQPETMVSIREAYVAVSRTGIVTPTENEEQRGTPTYTTWFGHEGGMGDEEQPGMMPPKPTGPGTPASTASTAITRAHTTTEAVEESQSSSRADKIGEKNDTTKTSEAPLTTSTTPQTAAAKTLAAQRAMQTATHMHDEYIRRYNTLAAAWPCPEDLALILDALATPVRAGLHKVLVYTPFSAVQAAQTPPVTREEASSILFLPPLGSHLVLVAQKLLILASFLQHLHPKFDPALRELRVPHRELLQRSVCATNTVVTGNDSLIGSLEGVQCLVMQGVIQSNQGNLRRAWLAFRRAMTMGQLMGLQRGFPTATIKSIDPSTQQPIVPQCLWFRIVYADRYLSLMLGLPQGAPGDIAVLCPAAAKYSALNAAQLGQGIPPPPIPSNLVGDEAGTAAFIALHQNLRKIEEAHAIIVGRIIERNEAWRGEDDSTCNEGNNCGGFNADDDGYSDVNNALSTQSIDLALQRASRNMPAQWWLTPQISEWDGDGVNMFMQTQRLVDQLFHYHLLTQLHLPYMLRRGTGASAKQAAESVAAETAAAAAEAVENAASADSIETEEAMVAVTMDRPTAHLLRLADDKTTTRTFSSSVSGTYGQKSSASASGGSSAAVGGSAGSVDKYAYSKITCVSASREVFMTLCLAHLDSHRNEQQQNQMVGNDFLAHQRLSDRGMMERVLESMDEMARLNEDDALSAKSAAFLRRMLDVEMDASLAVVASLGCKDAQATLRERAKAAPDDLRVWVPFLGTIRINKEGILRVNGNECSLVLSSEAKNPNPNGRANGTTNHDSGIDCVIGGPNAENREKHRREQEQQRQQRAEEDQQQQQQEQQQQEDERERQQWRQRRDEAREEERRLHQDRQQAQNESRFVPDGGPIYPPAPNNDSLDTLLPTVGTSAAFQNNLIASYPNYSAGETPVVNPLTGLAMVPSWSGVGSLGSTTTASHPLLFLPNNNPQASNYMFYTTPADPTNEHNSNGNNMSTTVNGNFMPASAASEGGYYNSAANLGGSADDWTLQGVDFAFFENLLMHGGLGDLTAGQTTSSGPANNIGDNAGGTVNAGTGNGSPVVNKDTTMVRASPENSKTGAPTASAGTQAGNNGTAVDDDDVNIPISTERRAGRLGDHWMWP
ncbi:hypothetical protein SBRCBS47491_005890 [Sporothrix bragantina]|uniref:Zn(2)-C6 fungal-type domain-containing protein n=1 Tax=Sporothrix bragantina TaxID=671064 RepID=A0ABP0C0V0_9PEZI